MTDCFPRATRVDFPPTRALRCWAESSRCGDHADRRHGRERTGLGTVPRSERHRRGQRQTADIVRSGVARVEGGAPRRGALVPRRRPRQGLPAIVDADRTGVSLPGGGGRQVAMDIQPAGQGRPHAHAQHSRIRDRRRRERPCTSRCGTGTACTCSASTWTDTSCGRATWGRSPANMVPAIRRSLKGIGVVRQ